MKTTEDKAKDYLKNVVGTISKHASECVIIDFTKGYETCQREYEEKLQKQKETILSILGHGDPYPLETVLEKLKWATEYLLHKKNYDGHSYEELGQSVRRANEILSILNTREAHFL